MHSQIHLLTHPFTDSPTDSLIGIILYIRHADAASSKRRVRRELAVEEEEMVMCSLMNGAHSRMELTHSLTHSLTQVLKWQVATRRFKSLTHSLMNGAHSLTPSLTPD